MKSQEVVAGHLDPRTLLALEIALIEGLHKDSIRELGLPRTYEEFPGSHSKSQDLLESYESY